VVPERNSSADDASELKERSSSSESEESGYNATRILRGDADKEGRLVDVQLQSGNVHKGPLKWVHARFDWKTERILHPVQSNLANSLVLV
jgi:hypothetical protein